MRGLMKSRRISTWAGSEISVLTLRIAWMIFTAMLCRQQLQAMTFASIFSAKKALQFHVNVGQAINMI